jgi:putative ABC transport system permease protein
MAGFNVITEGSNVYFIFRYPVFGGRPTSEMLARRQLTYGDGMAMKNLPHVVAVSPSQQYRTPSGYIGDFSMKYQGRKVQNTILEGVGEDNPKVNDVDLQEGRYFTSEEELRHTNVVILGHDAAEELFDTASAIGSGRVFTVAGVLPRRDYF